MQPEIPSLKCSSIWYHTSKYLSIKLDDTEFKCNESLEYFHESIIYSFKYILKYVNVINYLITHACSKSTTEALGQDKKYVNS